MPKVSKYKKIADRVIRDGVCYVYPDTPGGDEEAQKKMLRTALRLQIPTHKVVIHSGHMNGKRVIRIKLGARREEPSKPVE